MRPIGPGSPIRKDGLPRSTLAGGASDKSGRCPSRVWMMSVGLHCRLVGRPGRAGALMGFLDYIAKHERVWVPTRLQIAQHWHASMKHLAADAFDIG